MKKFMIKFRNYSTSYLPQMMALQKCKNCNNNNYNIRVYITKATNNLNKNQCAFLSVRFIMHKYL